ncbi:MAG: DUF4296 domain-containing protein, partial [Bacteroidia bacterium]|nr:DUF4296 domain-containing protein [Bacteroidia bacterium]MDW8335222.1 DUF4296 domain-containing protein [Bacteroidia bacterium]
MDSIQNYRRSRTCTATVINPCIAVILVLLAFLYSSCNQNKRLIEHEKFASVMMDLHLAESEIALTSPGNPELQHAMALQKYCGILKRHGIEIQTFLTTYQFYCNSPHDMNLLYEK